MDVAAAAAADWVEENISGMECSCLDAFAIEADWGVVVAEKLVRGDEGKQSIEKDCNESDGDGCGGLPAESPK